MPPNTRETRVRVWDPFVRYGHWVLVAAFAAAYLSAEEENGGPDPIHVWSGYAVGIIVAMRLLWGFVGTRHARFADFAYGPISALRYLNSLLRGQAQRYLGHSPAGAAMVYALLIALSGTVATGVIAYGDSGKGPLANARHTVTAPAVAAEDEKDAAGGDGDESPIAELHGTLANITLGLVILHILGVGLASFVHRENLVAAMITGRKRSQDGR
jgi:cytochrome b